ncbi:LPS-assembly lipoprotein [Kushneria sinocarnis]|uniref:LPS-assembly lipoprotein LptE n=1 Tax=Kushneria sinocarnis TaxID=595502 RepID=A0A420WVR6_9GAMM|nr:LPS assembly lipoprotein LptE [Kushneria sinocarnis]RKR02671.1 LPS-assembly lipoprotein [Kushneria sinocarnis]
MNRRSLLAALLAGTVMAGMVGCGFQLRGLGNSGELGMQRIALSSSESGPRDHLTREVRQALNDAGVTISDQAPRRLNLGNPDQQETELTYGDAGNQERQVTLTLPYSIQRTSDNAYLVSQQEVSVDGTYYTSEDQLLARDEQRRQLEQQLRREAAQRLIDRLRALDDNGTL